jgi:AcrR family transcriptional regulator
MRAKTADRRQAILDAALPLFASRGLRGTSIGHVRAASRASVGSIYHHFGSKEGIAAQLYAGAIASYQQEVLGVLRAATRAEGAITGVVRHFLSWVGENRDLAQLMLAVGHGDVRRLAARQVAALNRTFMRDARDLLAPYVARGQLPALPDDVFLAAVLGPARRFAELWVSGRTRTPLDEAARTLARLTWSGMKR